MFLSLIEYAFPKPLPFMRIGFANMSIMLSIFALSFRQTLLLVLIKVLFQGLISGTIFSYVFLFSFFGSFASFFFMQLVVLIFKNHISFLGIGMAGALSNILMQIALSYAMIFKENTKYIAPLLLITGLISSILLGIFTEIFSKNSRWYKNMKNSKTEDYPIENKTTNQTVDEKAVLERKKISFKKIFLNFLKDFFLILSIVFFSLLIPSGKVLYSAGSFAITQGALTLGLKRALVLVLSVQLSKLIIPRKLVFKGKFGLFINQILLYFRLLSEFEIKDSRKTKNVHSTPDTLVDKKNRRTNFIARLDDFLVKIYV